MNLPYSKILMVIVQVKYVNNFTNYLRKTLSLKIQCNLKIVSYLDNTLDLNTGTYKPYH